MTPASAMAMVTTVAAGTRFGATSFGTGHTTNNRAARSSGERRTPVAASATYFAGSGFATATTLRRRRASALFFGAAQGGIKKFIIITTKLLKLSLRGRPRPGEGAVTHRHCAPPTASISARVKCTGSKLVKSSALMGRDLFPSRLSRYSATTSNSPRKYSRFWARSDSDHPSG